MYKMMFNLYKKRPKRALRRDIQQKKPTLAFSAESIYKKSCEPRLRQKLVRCAGGVAYVSNIYINLSSIKICGLHGCGSFSRPLGEMPMLLN